MADFVVAPRDCLAPPYTVSEDLNGAKPPVKTCYRCKEDGHVRLGALGLPAFLFLPVLTFLLLLQIAKDCTEGREVAEEEEDTAWAEVQDDPWGNVAHPVDEAN